MEISVQTIDQSHLHQPSKSKLSAKQRPTTLTPLQTSLDPSFKQADQDRPYKKQLRLLNEANRELVNQLMDINKKLSKKLQNQKLRASPTKKQQTAQKDTQVVKLRKQLLNAQKQISNYKSEIEILSIKTNVDCSDEKMNEINNRIRVMDQQIESLSRQIKVQQRILSQQKKTLSSNVLSQDSQNLFKQKQKEIQSLKKKLQTLKKNDLITKDQLELQKYQVNLQKRLRNCTKDLSADASKLEPVDQESWNRVQSLHKQMQSQNRGVLQKIETVRRQTAKAESSNRSRKERNIQKQKQIEKLKRKIQETRKLVKKNQHSPFQNLSSLGEETPPPVPTLEAADSPLLPQLQVAHQEQGKSLSSSISFSRAGEKGGLICEVTVYLTEDEYPVFVTAKYQNKQEVSSSQIQSEFVQFLDKLRPLTFSFDQSDYLSNLGGSINDKGQINALIFQTINNKIFKAGKLVDAVGFRFKVEKDELPTLLYGAANLTQDGLRLCHLGCDVIKRIK